MYKRDLSNLALAALAAKKTGWHYVYCGDGSFDSFQRLHVQAKTYEAAIETVRAQYPDAAPITSVTPAPDPSNAGQVLIGSIAAATAWITDHLRMDARSYKRMDPEVAYEESLVLSDILPSCYASRYTASLLDRFGDVVDAVSGKLALYPATYLRSTAEELAAHAILEQAAASIECAFDEGEIDDAVAEKVSRKLREMQDGAFEDWDVLELFEEDGWHLMDVEHIRIEDWFLPFSQRPDYALTA